MLHLINLLMSFYHQCDVLLHQGTTFSKLLLLSQIGNAMEKNSVLIQVRLTFGQTLGQAPQL